MGCSSVRLDRDAWGRPTREAYFSTEGVGVADPDGVAVYRWSFNEWGDPVEEHYLDPAGRPVLNRVGVAGMRRVYDAQGNAIRFENLGMDGSLAEGSEGIAITTVQ